MEWEPRDRMELNEQKKEYSAVTRNCFEWVEAVVTSIVVVVLLFTFLFVWSMSTASRWRIPSITRIRCC